MAGPRSAGSPRGLLAAALLLAALGLTACAGTDAAGLLPGAQRTLTPRERVAAQLEARKAERPAEVPAAAAPGNAGTEAALPCPAICLPNTGTASERAASRVSVSARGPVHASAR